MAALKSDGAVATWGNADYGGDSSAVASELTSDVQHATAVASELTSDVQHVTAGGGSAMAALKSDGAVATWGNADCGGDSSAVASELTSDVQHATAGGAAMAALKSDGAVVTWGDADAGAS